MTLAEIEEYLSDSSNYYMDNTVSKPWKGESYVAGTVGGTWNTVIQGDPKSFNLYIAERDATTAGIIGETTESLTDYDYVNKKWVARAADFKVEVDEKNKKVSVFYKLRDDLYWSYYNSDKKIPVTSDDVIFWYNEIVGDPAFQSSGYPQQFVELDDGTQAHIDIEKISEKEFVFRFPVMEADPVLATNMNFGPSFLYAPAKKEGGVQAVQELFKVSEDPKTIPSCGRWFITEYVPARRLVFTRNPDFWEKDLDSNAMVYPQQKVAQIVSDTNTQYLLFKEGKLEAYGPRPEELDDVIANQKNDYTVFNAEGSLGAALWSFNQNPKNKDKVWYKWFCTKEFRQAMSCLLNRERIIKQVYRGLGSAKLDFFPSVNPFYNPDIVLKYQFDLAQALNLLKKAGFYLDEAGKLFDSDNNPVEFDLAVPSGITMYNDIAQILADECSKVGINLRIKQVDFQKLVEELTANYGWQSIMISLGSNIFPSQGSNVWPSKGNLHLWYPLQEKPATEWEARIDYLYNKAKQIVNHDEAKVLWDEYQNIILEQCPIIYLIRSKSFSAIRNKWNLDNYYYDNMGGAQTNYVFLREK